MKYHFAHLNRIDVSVGQKVNKGDIIGLMGKTGTKSVHLHFEIQRVFRGVTDYTKGLSQTKVVEYYQSPYDADWRSIAPFSHLGWGWLSDIGGGQLHPGIDINSALGDADLNTTIKSPISGIVYYAGDDTNSGWGKHIFIEERIDMEQLDLFREISSSKVYVRTWGNYLSYIPTTEELKKYFGDNPRIYDENDIHSAGQICTEMDARIKKLESDLAGMTKQKEDQMAKNATLVAQNQECNTEVESMHTLLEDSQEQIDDLNEKIDNMTLEDPIVDSEPSGGLWQVFVAWLSKIFKK